MHSFLLPLSSRIGRQRGSFLWCQIIQPGHLILGVVKITLNFLLVNFVDADGRQVDNIAMGSFARDNTIVHEDLVSHLLCDPLPLPLLHLCLVYCLKHPLLSCEQVVLTLGS